MEVSYIREPRTSYMRIRAHEDGTGYRMQMVEENDIPELLHVSERSVNDTVYFMYDISSKLSVDEAYSKSEWMYSDIVRLTGALKNLYYLTEKYLLSMDDVVLEVDKIFLDGERKNFLFCYYAGKEKTFDEEVRELFEYLIRNVCHKDSAAVTAAYGIYKRIMSGSADVSEIFEIENNEEESRCVIEEETSCISEVIPERVSEEREVFDRKKLLYPAGIAILLIAIVIGLVRKITALTVCAVCVVIAGVFYLWYRKKKDRLTAIVSRPHKIPYETGSVRIGIPKKAVEDSNNLTMILSGKDAKISHCIKWEDENGSRKYVIGESSFIVGSSADRADCVINADGISRMHARISKEGENYYVKDLNSTNGTFVNGRQLACFEMCPLRPDDVIVFGNVSCVFV